MFVSQNSVLNLCLAKNGGVRSCGCGLSAPQELQITSRGYDGSELILAGWWFPALSSYDAQRLMLQIKGSFETQALPQFNTTNQRATIIIIHGHGSNMGQVRMQGESSLCGSY